MLGLGLSLGELALRSPVAVPIALPGGFGWTPPAALLSNNATDVDFDALKPTPAYTYYLDGAGSPSASPSDNDPSTPITPRRFVTLANANGGVVRGVYKQGQRWWGNVGFDGNNFTCAGIILEPWVGQGSGPSFSIKSGAATAPTWTLDTGTTYKTPQTLAGLPVTDLKYPDAGGCCVRLNLAADLAACRATPGTTFNDGASQYVNPIDGRNLVGDQDMAITVSSLVFNYTPSIDAVLWMDGLGFVGTIKTTCTTAGKTVQVYTRDCRFFGSTSDAFQHLGPITGHHLRPRIGGAKLDGMNYHGNAQGDPKFIEEDLRSVRCGYDASGLNNTSTAHENAIVLSAGGDYAGSQNRPIHDINNARRYMRGSRVRASAAADATAITVQAGLTSGTAIIWLDRCVIEPSVSGGLHAESGCAIYIRDTSLAGLTISGAGAVSTF